MKGTLGFDALSAYWGETTWEDLVPGYKSEESLQLRRGAASDRMLRTLLPHQLEFVKDKTTRHLGLVAGFGSGKSHGLVTKALQLAFDNPGFTGIFMEPSFGMIRDIVIPLATQLYEDWGVTYTYRKSPEPELQILCPDGQVSIILLRSFENVSRIRGINAAWALVDEIDTVNADLADQAYKLLMGRVRTGILPQLAVGSTPEGWGWMYQFFVEQADASKRLIKARTTDNPFLPESYIEDLRTQYPPEMLAAYLNGEFCNLAKATVFSEYDRIRHNSIITAPESDEPVYVACDFNVGQCHQIHAVIRQERQRPVAHVFRQTVTKTTYELADLLRRMYPNQLIQGKLFAAPDASGSHGSTSSTQTDHRILEDRGIRLISGRSNPGVADTIAHVNSLFHQDRLKINFGACSSLATVCERWAYDKKGQPSKGGSGDMSHEGDCLRYLAYWGLNGAHRTMRTGSRLY